ncbi:hypothetical protein HDU97_004581 [Phlyctochytrium planicorne]|nr:hypothetical protein HDU97_004581 [Phlyctochytrium planicorne]
MLRSRGVVVAAAPCGPIRCSVPATVKAIRTASTESNASSTAEASKTSRGARLWTKEKRFRLDVAERKKIPDTLLDPTIPGADPIIVLQNAIKARKGAAGYRAFDAIVKKDLKVFGEDGLAPIENFLIPRMTPEEVTAGFKYTSSQNQRLAMAGTSGEAEGIRFYDAFNKVLKGGSVAPSNFFRALVGKASVITKGGKGELAYTVMAEAMSKAKMLNATKEDLIQAYTSALQNMVVNDRVEHGVELMEAMVKTLKTAPPPVLVKNLFTKLGYVGKVDESVRLLELLKEHKIALDPHIFAGIIHGYAYEGKITLAVKYFLEITRNNLKPGPESYEALLRAHARRLQPADALQIYRDCRSAGLPATSAMQSDLIASYGATGDMTSAIKFFHKNESVIGFIPSIDMFAATIGAFAFNGEMVSAWRETLMGLRRHGKMFLVPSTFRSLGVVHGALNVEEVYRLMDVVEFRAPLKPVMAGMVARTMVPDFSVNAVKEGSLKYSPLLPAEAIRPEPKVAAEKALALVTEILKESKVEGSTMRPDTVNRAVDTVMSAHIVLGSHAKAVEAYESFKPGQAKSNKRVQRTLLEVGCLLKDKAVVAQALDEDGFVSAGAVESVVKAFGLGIQDGKLIGLDSGDTGVGSVAEVVERFLERGGVPSAVSEPVLAAYVGERGLNVLLHEAV